MPDVLIDAGIESGDQFMNLTLVVAAVMIKFHVLAHMGDGAGAGINSLEEKRKQKEIVKI